ncbi:hypothetical protein [Anatilimnocola floriformis]|uniref:hypothetical protein n=1 Tax=Anatilimnocola floriformis TaxID=2948575 RepID=UPI0020C40A58|nr:hypothetical protein [Anatilimnocola floriformis]
MTGIVKKMRPKGNAWVVMELEPTGLISGSLDPASKAIIQVGFADSVITPHSIPQVGDKVLVLCYDRLKAITDDERVKKPDHGDYLLRIGYVRAAGNESVCGVSILERPGERSDKAAAEARVQAVLERIRKIRAFK